MTNIQNTAMVGSADQRFDQALQRGLFTVDSDTSAASTRGNLELRDMSFYVKKEVTGMGNNVDLLLSTDAFVQGQINIEREELKKGTLFLCESVLIKYSGAVDSATVDDPLKVTDWKTAAKDVHPSVREGKLEIWQSGKKVAVIEASRCFYNTDQEGYQLQVPIALSGGSKLMFRYEFAKPIPTTADKKYYVSVELNGIGTEITG